MTICTFAAIERAGKGLGTHADTRDAFAAHYGLRRHDWSRRSVRSVFGLGGAGVPAVEAAIDAIFGRLYGGLLGDHSGIDNLFDHFECWGRDNRALFLVGFPYGVRECHRGAIEIMRGLRLDVVIDGAPSWYGYGTNSVVVTHLATAERLCREVATIPRVAKRWWSVGEWRAFVDSLSRIRRILHAFYTMPATRGARARHLKPFAKAHWHIGIATLRLENVLVAHMGGEDRVPGGAIAFARGQWPGRDRDPSDCAIAGIRDGREPEGIPACPLDEWRAWSDRAQEAMDLFRSLSLAIAGAKGRDVGRFVAAFEKAEKATDEGRRMISQLFFEQHPEQRSNPARLFGGWNI